MAAARTDSSLAAEFGKRVRAAREALGLTQEALAERLGSHRTFPGSIERGEVGPSLVTVVRLGAALEVDPGDLVKGLRPSEALGKPRPPRPRR